MASTAERRLLEICSADSGEFPSLRQELEELLQQQGLHVDTADEHGMTGLMHVAYRGNTECCRLLLDRGADVNCNLHTEGYTALMFAVLAGHADVVALLLDAGANPATINNKCKSASEMGAFVGQHRCVSIINNFFPASKLERYCKPQGVESAAKLRPELSPALHTLLTLPSVHPVKVLQSIPDAVLEEALSVSKVLQLLSAELMNERNEALALKAHYLSFILQQASGAGGAAPLISRLLACAEDGSAVMQEGLLREVLKQFPHTHSSLLQQLVSTLAKVPPGGHPSAAFLLHSAIIGSKSVEGLESCSTCGDYSSSAKKCSKCRKVWYCNVECQQLAWSHHRKLCRKWAALDTP